MKIKVFAYLVLILLTPVLPSGCMCNIPGIPVVILVTATPFRATRTHIYPIAIGVPTRAGATKPVSSTPAPPATLARADIAAKDASSTPRVSTPGLSGVTKSYARTPTPDVPSRPEELIDSELLPGWRKLSGSQISILRRLAQVALDYHIPIRFGTPRNPAAFATYRLSVEGCKSVPGSIVVSRDEWSKRGEEELAATLAHELSHAVDAFSDGICECTIDGEFRATVVYLYTLQELGRQDIIASRFSYTYDSDGRFDENVLYKNLKSVYPDCK